MDNTAVLVQTDGTLPPGARKPRVWLGVVGGVSAALIGALYSVYATYGMAHGMRGEDINFLRSAVAGLVFLPALVMRVAKAPRETTNLWKPWIIVGILTGPLFGVFNFTAFQVAPATYGTVFPFAAMAVMGTVLAALFLSDHLTIRKVIGIVLVIIGLVVVSGLRPHQASSSGLYGAGLFIVSGTMWAGFGVVMRKYRIEPILAATAGGMLGLVIYVPFYLATEGLGRLQALEGSVLWTEILVQGVLAGCGTIYAFSRAVQCLGAARASIFPALVPGLAALLAWPVLGRFPTVHEGIGVALVIGGLLTTVAHRVPPENHP